MINLLISPRANLSSIVARARWKSDGLYLGIRRAAKSENDRLASSRSTSSSVGRSSSSNSGLLAGFLFGLGFFEDCFELTEIFDGELLDMGHLYAQWLTVGSTEFNHRRCFAVVSIP